VSTPFRIKWMDGQGCARCATLTDELKRHLIRFLLAIGRGNPELN